MIDNQMDETIQTQQTAPENLSSPREGVDSTTPPSSMPSSFAETDYAKNMRALREKAERLERERNEALRLADEARRSSQPEENLDINIGDDDYAEGKHLSKLNKKINRLEQELTKAQQRNLEIAMENRLAIEYPDWKKVLTSANVEALAQQQPELAAAINSSNDLYSKAASTIKLIKQFGIYNEDLYQTDKSLAQRNAAKPKPMASISPQQGDTPLSRANAFANGLTSEVKSALWKEMEESRRNYGT